MNFDAYLILPANRDLTPSELGLFVIIGKSAENYSPIHDLYYLKASLRKLENIYCSGVGWGYSKIRRLLVKLNEKKLIKWHPSRSLITISSEFKPHA